MQSSSPQSQTSSNPSLTLASNATTPRRRISLGICGIGTVGGGTVEVLLRNAQEINARSGVNVELTHLGSRRELAHIDTSNIRVSNDVFAVAQDSDVDILVELIGGTTVARDLVITAIKAGKHVVTANKALIAEHGNELFALADKHRVSIAFESAVAGGIPIISALREGLAANRIDWLAGIINGTGNFILSEMREKGREFKDVLAEAQELGYAEADPTFDVEGIDAAHKLVILASIAFGMPLDFDKVYTEGIGAIETVDVEYAEELGFRIKHLGIAKRRSASQVEIRVHPTLIPDKRLIANVNGVMNAVVVHGDAVGPTLYYGAGAGAEPTASAVIADIVRLCRGLQDGKTDEGDRLAPSLSSMPSLGVSAEQLATYKILEPTEFVSSYYLRVTAEDRPGVLAHITQILSGREISVRAIIQKNMDDEHDCLPIIILTNYVKEALLNEAISDIAKLESVRDDIVRIRVEDLA